MIANSGIDRNDVRLPEHATTSLSTPASNILLSPWKIEVIGTGFGTVTVISLVISRDENELSHYRSKMLN